MGVQENLNLLIIEDSPLDAKVVLHELKRGGFNVTHKRVDTVEELIEAASEGSWDLIIADYNLPTCDAPTIIQHLKYHEIFIPVIVVSGTVGEDIAVETLKVGASDYVLKQDLKRLVPAVKRELHALQVFKEGQSFQQSLTEREAQLSAIVSQAMDAIISVDIDQKITLFNAAAEKMFGYQAEEILGKPIHQLLPEGVREEQKELITQYIQTITQGTNLGILRELKGLRATGESFPLEASVSSIEVGGQSVITAIIRDLSERKKLESQLRESQKREVVGELAVGIAHDFNNILAAVMGYSQLALYASENPALVQANVSAVIQAAMRARGIIRRILTFGTTTHAQPEVLRIKTAVEEIISLMKATLPSSVTLETGIDTPNDFVFVDPNQLHQIILNLCTNAVAALPESKGTIKVTTAIKNLSEPKAAEFDLPPGNYLALSVTDTGRGMSPDTLRRIFEPFFTTKPRGQGSGLGLAVVRSIIKEISGSISVSSSPDKGSTFTTYIPLYTDEQKTSPSEVNKPSLEGQGHVLVIDDEPILADLLKQFLVRLGYEVTSLTNPLEALEYFRLQPDNFDLLISDQTMPNMSGTALVQEVRRLRQDIPALICSGFGALDQPASKAPLNMWIGKPFTFDELGSAVQKLLNSDS